MKKKIGSLRNKKIVTGNKNLVTKNEIHLEDTKDGIKLYVRNDNNKLVPITVECTHDDTTTPTPPPVIPEEPSEPSTPVANIKYLNPDILLYDTDTEFRISHFNYLKYKGFEYLDLPFEEYKESGADMYTLNRNCSEVTYYNAEGILQEAKKGKNLFVFDSENDSIIVSANSRIEIPTFSVLKNLKIFPFEIKHKIKNCETCYYNESSGSHRKDFENIKSYIELAENLNYEDIKSGLYIACYSDIDSDRFWDHYPFMYKLITDILFYNETNCTLRETGVRYTNLNNKKIVAVYNIKTDTIIFTNTYYEDNYIDYDDSSFS